MVGPLRYALLGALLTSCGSGAATPGPAPDAADTPPAEDGGVPIEGGVAAGGVVELVLEVDMKSTILPVTVGQVVVESALLSLHELSVASDTGVVRMRGGQTIDFSAGAVSLPLDVPRPGLYSRVVMELEGEGEGASAPAGRHFDIRLAGKLVGGPAFSLTGAGDDFRIDVSAATPFDLLPGGRLHARVAFDLGQWLQGITLPPGDPVVVDATQHPELLPRFRANVVRSAALTFE